jgi:uncharacterized protein YbbK (DUF523 family)
MEKLGISACLLGVNCKYDGKNNLNLELIRQIQGKELILICPEVMGGLSTPRIPSEVQQDGIVMNTNHEDVTNAFDIGKVKALEKLQNHGCNQVVLKDGSPSCGFRFIYDGSFSGTKIKGEGITTQYLRQHNIKIIEFKEAN